MSRPCEKPGCGADMYLCQECGKDLCSKETPPVWVVGKGNVCPICSTKYVVNGVLTLLGYYYMTQNARCGYCDGELAAEVDHYNHDTGWEVAGFKEKQWLSRRCNKCRYDWSLNKLECPRPRGRVVVP